MKNLTNKLFIAEKTKIFPHKVIFSLSDDRKGVGVLSALVGKHFPTQFFFLSNNADFDGARNPKIMRLSEKLGYKYEYSWYFSEINPYFKEGMLRLWSTEFKIKLV